MFWNISRKKARLRKKRRFLSVMYVVSSSKITTISKGMLSKRFVRKTNISVNIAGKSLTLFLKKLNMWMKELASIAHFVKLLPKVTLASYSTD